MPTSGCPVTSISVSPQGITRMHETCTCHRPRIGSAPKIACLGHLCNKIFYWFVYLHALHGTLQINLQAYGLNAVFHLQTPSDRIHRRFMHDAAWT